jgi:sulfate transport system permease protein
MTDIALPPRAARRYAVLPGLPATLGITLVYLSILVLVPLAGLFIKAGSVGLPQMIALVTSPRSLAAFRVSFGIAAAAALTNAVLGLLVAWALERYDFPGRRLLDALVDLPFALPTAVAGIALTALYADNGWIGASLAPYGVQIAFTRLGIFVALLFTGLPYVIRAVQPVLADLGRDVEEASLTLGATGWQTFRYVIAPPLAAPLLTGIALAFARGVGEYGSVIFIAGNMPGVSEIVPLLIVVHLEQFDYAGASVLASAMLIASFCVLLALNLLQTGWRAHER